MSEKFRKVTEAEFKAWLEAYPRPLEAHLCTIMEPEPLQYCDRTLGVWPEFVVAYYLTWGCDPKDTWAKVPGEWHVLADTPATLEKRE